MRQRAGSNVITILALLVVTVALMFIAAAVIVSGMHEYRQRQRDDDIP
jgi:hypothetical protein